MAHRGFHREARPAFLKKRSKKLLCPGAHPTAAASYKESKVFCFFFSKKKALLFS
jgi:hypothetical protein